MEITRKDIDFILESLRYTKIKFADYPIGPTGYPTYQYKQERIKEVDGVIYRLRDYRDSLPKGG